MTWTSFSLKQSLMSSYILLPLRLLRRVSVTLVSNGLLGSPMVQWKNYFGEPNQESMHKERIRKKRNEKGDSVNASYYHIVNPLTNIVVGVEVTHRFSSNVNTVTMGTQHALDPLTTIKAPVNNADKASTLIQHEWSPKSLFTNFREVDTKSIDKSPKVKLALTLKL